MSAPDPPDVDRLRAALARLGEEEGWPEADSERLFSALHGDMSAEERREVVEELIRNPRAAAAWRLARSSSRQVQPSAALGLAAMGVAADRGRRWCCSWAPRGNSHRGDRKRRSIEAPIRGRSPRRGRLERCRARIRYCLDGDRGRAVSGPRLDAEPGTARRGPGRRARIPAAAGVCQERPPDGSMLWQVEARFAGCPASCRRPSALS